MRTSFLLATQSEITDKLFSRTLITVVFLGSPWMKPRIETNPVSRSKSTQSPFTCAQLPRLRRLLGRADCKYAGPMTCWWDGDRRTRGSAEGQITMLRRFLAYLGLTKSIVMRRREDANMGLQSSGMSDGRRKRRGKVGHSTVVRWRSRRRGECRMRERIVFIGGSSWMLVSESCTRFIILGLSKVMDAWTMSRVETLQHCSKETETSG